MVCKMTNEKQEILSQPPLPIYKAGHTTDIICVVLIFIGMLLSAGFFGALDLGEGRVSFAVTERRTKEEIDALVACLKEVRL